MLNSTSAVAAPVSNAPFYRAVGDEVEVFRAAARRGLPVLLKGPTGCGKTRFVEAMAHQLGRELITVAGHEDMTSADLVGRFLLKGGETVWVDGPLTRAVREGAIFYLDEVVEARQDTTVVIHPLADHRRELARRPARHHTAGGARISVGDLLQPRIPERTEEPQGVDASTLHRHRTGLPVRRDRDRGGCLRSRDRYRDRTFVWSSSRTPSATWTAHRCAKCPPPAC